MNKDLIIKLVKVANNLDEMGFSKEANHLDKIASKIVLSENPVVEILRRNVERTGVYPIDIANYKSLFYYAYHDDSDMFLENPLLENLKYATKLYNSVVNDPFSPYTKQQKEAFKQQAARIRSDIENDFEDVNANDGIIAGKKKYSLNDNLMRNNIIDQYGQLLSYIKTRKQLRGLFTKVTSNTDDENLLKQYTKTFHILSRNLPEG